MQVKTAVTIVWTDEKYDWHWFWLHKIDNHGMFLTGADCPDGTHHKGDSFWVNHNEVAHVEKGHKMPPFAGCAYIVS